MSTMSPTAARPAMAGPAFVRWIGAPRTRSPPIGSAGPRQGASANWTIGALRDIGLARCHIEAAVGGALNPDMGRFR